MLFFLIYDANARSMFAFAPFGAPNISNETTKIWTKFRRCWIICVFPTLHTLPIMRKDYFLVLAMASALLLAGCAGSPLRSYDSELKETVGLVRTGALDQALTHLEKNNKPVFDSDAPAQKDGQPKEKTVLDSVNGKDILYYLEKGELLSLKKEYEKSRASWLMADEIVRSWEDEFRTNSTKLIGDVGSFLVSDRVRRYDGQDYEKVFLSAKLTMGHILMGNFDHARVEMKKTYEREKLIESYREKEYEALKEEQGKQTQVVKADLKDLSAKGYPLDELDAPEVRELKNGFQNAFAHYLAGYFFEVTGEYSLAEPGYRNALALQPNSRLIKSKVGNVGKNKPGPNETDVLFVVESGFAPAWKSVTIPLPIPVNGRVVATPLSFPVVKAEGKSFMPTSLKAGGKEVEVETLVNVDAMARRLLKDQLPGIMGRTVVRAVAKSAAQYQLQKNAGPVAGLLAGAASVVTEQADERAWRTLPERLAVARAILPRGTVPIEFQTGAGSYKTEITVGNRVTVIPVRLASGAVYVGQPQVEVYADAFPDEPVKPAKPAKVTKGGRTGKSK